jgi:hypothetical protein
MRIFVTGDGFAARSDAIVHAAIWNDPTMLTSDRHVPPAWSPA